MLIFDIETAPLPDTELSVLCPEFSPPPNPGEFDPSAVKYGNTKDEMKRAAILAEAKAKHETAVQSYDRDRQLAVENHFANFKANAALSPITGRVLAIGFRAADNGKFAIEDGGGDEEELLNRFWAKYCKCKAQPGGPRKLVGWNIHGFDLPFLVRRSWRHGVAVPSDVRDANDRYWNPLFVDLMGRFTLGAWKEFAKLETAARFFGVGAKNGNGADFGRLWLGTAAERNQAVEYLRNDLEITAAVGQRMGVM